MPEHMVHASYILVQKAQHSSDQLASLKLHNDESVHEKTNSLGSDQV